MSKRELYAAVVAILVGLPLVFLLSRAFADGLTRYHEAPLRSVLGNATFERLANGEQTPIHYMGNEFAAPNFALKDRHGRSFKLSDHRGKTIVLNFWSVTCPPCIQEIPELEELTRITRPWGDVEVVTVSTDDGWKKAKTVLSDQTPLRVLFDPKKAVVEKKYGSKLFPETWLIDKRGIIRFRYDGAFDWASPLALELIGRFR